MRRTGRVALGPATVAAALWLAACHDGEDPDAGAAVRDGSALPADAGADATNDASDNPVDPRDASSDAADAAQTRDAHTGPDLDADSADADAAQEAGPAACDRTPRSVAFDSDILLPDPERGPNDSVVTGSIRAVSLAGDAEAELLVLETERGELNWLRDCGDGTCQSRTFDLLGKPVRAAVADAEGDGDLDIFVADLGSIPAVPDLVGRVVLLVNQGDFTFTRRLLLGNVGRVSCAEPGDFDGDGDTDVVVCEFGAVDGALRWLERNADNTYTSHVIKQGSGAIEAFPLDVDDDGRLDVVASMSQDFQQVTWFRNAGDGSFEEHVLFQASEDFGLVGLEMTDLDRDGDADFVVSGGDYFDATYDLAEHGVVWLENQGEGHFEARTLAKLVGPHVTRSADIDGDCDLDVAVASYRVPGLLPPELHEEPGLWWLENDGAQQFTPHPLNDAGFTHTVALELVDYGDGPTWFVGSFTVGASRESDVRLGTLRPR